MRRILELVATAAMLVVSGVAAAQMVDPSTGIPIDPTTDPVDFANAMSGQPTNIGMEAAAYAMQQAQAAATASQAAAQSAMDASSAFPTNDTDSTPAGPAIAHAPKPVMKPNGGNFNGVVQVVIADKDAQAVIHYTIDGSEPTAASPAYVAPLMVTQKTKVRALATHSGELPSGVLTKTFKTKS